LEVATLLLDLISLSIEVNLLLLPVVLDLFDFSLDIEVFQHLFFLFRSRRLASAAAALALLLVLLSAAGNRGVLGFLRLFVGVHLLLLDGSQLGELNLPFLIFQLTNSAVETIAVLLVERKRFPSLLDALVELRIPRFVLLVYSSDLFFLLLLELVLLLVDLNLLLHVVLLAEDLLSDLLLDVGRALLLLFKLLVH